VSRMLYSNGIQMEKARALELARAQVQKREKALAKAQALVKKREEAQLQAQKTEEADMPNTPTAVTPDAVTPVAKPQRGDEQTVATPVKRRNDGRAFEDYSIKYHQEKYPNHTVYHSRMIPEDDLFAAGIFHEENATRLLRLAHARNERNCGTVLSPYVDDGIDFLVKAVNGDEITYHVGQSKNYATARVCQNHLTGFFRNLLRTRSLGYLYTTSPLETSLCEDLKRYPDTYVHEMLDFDPNTVSVRETSRLIQETSYALRSYQNDAIQALLQLIGEDGSGSAKTILYIGCGLGKTLITGHLIQRIKNTRDPKLYIFIAPLRVSVANLVDRVLPFFNSSASSSSSRQFKSVLVDSDSGGVTDPTYIGKILKKGEPTVIFSTYESFFGMLSQEFGQYLTDEDAFLIVDEMHNLNADQCAIVNQYNTSLLMSATVSKEVRELLDAKVDYTYTMADGIRDGYLCDYEIILPLTKTVSVEEDDANDADDANDEDVGRGPQEKTVVDVDFPSEMLHDDMTGKALFLATGMLRTGSRRCIVYLRSSEECVLFMERFRRVCEEYHGLLLWCEKMDYTVGARRRTEILKEFQENEDHDIYVIASIRILDEAVDLPRCDSEMITYVGDNTSDVRTVQRLQRGGRLDPTNLAKKNHLFMWCSDLAPALNALNKMREEDCDFSKKMRVMSSNYEQTGTTSVVNRSRAQKEETIRYITVKSAREQDIWLQQFERCKAFCSKTGKWPRANGEGEEQFSAKWISAQQKAKRDNMLSDDRIQILNAVPGWLWDPRDELWNNYYAILMKFIQTHNRFPEHGHDPEEYEKGLASWINKQCTAKKEGMLSGEKCGLLETVPGWLWDRKDAKWRQAYADMISFINRHNRLPLLDQDYDEYDMATWINTQKKDKSNGKLEDKYIRLLNTVPGWSWDTPSDIKWNNNYTLLAQFISVNKRPPRQLYTKTEADKEESRLASWIQTQRASKKAETLPEDKCARLNAIPGWSWGRG